MSSLFKSSIVFLTLAFLFVVIASYSSPIFALHDLNMTEKCTFISINPPAVLPAEREYLDANTKYEYTLHVNAAGTYKAYLQRGFIGEIAHDNLTPDKDGFLRFKNTPGIMNTSATYKKGVHNIEIERHGATGSPCVMKYTISGPEDTTEVTCNLNVSPQVPNPETPVTYSGTITPAGLYRFKIPSLVARFSEQRGYIPKDGFRPDGNNQISLNLGIFDAENYDIILQRYAPELFPDGQGGSFYQNVWKDIPRSSCGIKNLVVLPKALNPNPDLAPAPVGIGTSTITKPIIPAISKGSPCGPEGDPGIRTAIGCVRTNPISFVKDTVSFIIGIAGGLAFLMMLLGAFQMLSSGGNPDSLHAGRERLTNAIIGLLFVIFATLLLQIIGADILKIPGFIR